MLHLSRALPTAALVSSVMERGVHISRRRSATLGGSGYGVADKDCCTTHLFVSVVPSGEIGCKMGNCHLPSLCFLSTPRPDQMKLPVPLPWLSRLAYYEAPDL
ncbi:uncharacterized protein TrAtP1_009917 [Trichoderma atroviride]|uniref:uncharacterized protein n=1 Tax=Hypocrea atroviridis TaxID=63577 RepID=UPI0033179C14|nr:hypothetical protein TrAtP1_009917 [Trichoderma atroviride]